MTEAAPERVMERARALREPMVEFLTRLARVESPTEAPAAQREIFGHLGGALAGLGFEVRTVPGRRSGGVLFARPEPRSRTRPAQLMLGHADTVWPVGTLGEMPVRLDGDRLYGPGTFDMKGGLTQIVFALRILRELALEPEVTPLVLVNSDEEEGSVESKKWVRMLARRVCRAYVIEPSMGPEGLLKTARKGVGTFTVIATGKAAHAGLDPGAGASAILELANVIRRLHGLSDPERGRTVNVGVIEGGIRPNVVAPEARALVDVRITTMADGEELTREIRGLTSQTAGVRLHVEGGIRVAPLERTSRNRRLWESARRMGGALGLELDETLAGGGSDGNTASQYTATLDGLGPVGDGAHAPHEHVHIDGLVERCALLACLLMAPAEPAEPAEVRSGG